jgi:dTDP-4-dehydrorhamnose 3,5-epimerase
MKLENTDIADVKVITPSVFFDDRGFFFESFNLLKLKQSINTKINFVQDNQSFSRRGVLRGMHYQIDPFAQDKLVRVLSGEIFDVALDIRESSPSYGKSVGVYLSSKNKKQLWIPKGFAHGFLTMSDTAEILYKTSNYYSPEHERTISFKDKRFSLTWPKLDIDYILSDKDSL